MDVKSLKANLYQDALEVNADVTAEVKSTNVNPTNASNNIDSLVVSATSKSANANALVSDFAAPKASTAAIQSAKLETQLAGDMQLARLRNELVQEVGDQTDVVAVRKPIIRDNNMTTVPWAIHRDTFDALQKNHPVPKTILTGPGDDMVDIQKDVNGRIHVNVNGKEAWNGTFEEFQVLTIDTGEGQDTVKNFVDGANIFTGKGIDTVDNKSNNSTINTGDDNDTVYNTNSYNYYRWFQLRVGHDTSIGNNNTIETGQGDDTVINEGNYNIIQTGSDNDTVKSEWGNGNTINTGEGEKDTVDTYGWYDKVYDPDNQN